MMEMRRKVGKSDEAHRRNSRQEVNTKKLSVSCTCNIHAKNNCLVQTNTMQATRFLLTAHTKRRASWRPSAMAKAPLDRNAARQTPLDSKRVAKAITSRAGRARRQTHTHASHQITAIAGTALSHITYCRYLRYSNTVGRRLRSQKSKITTARVVITPPTTRLMMTPVVPGSSPITPAAAAPTEESDRRREEGKYKGRRYYKLGPTACIHGRACTGQ